MASFTLKNIHKRFGRTEVLSDINFHVKDGTFCVLLGPSGCGKSTLLKIIAGLIPQDKGTVFLDEKPIDRLYPGERDVAMVFQNYALYPHMTVRENLAFGLKMRKVQKPVIKDRIFETARLLEIEDLMDRKPRQLSGGQQQRVAMGRALVRRPKIFLLDEPLSNLDARLRNEVRLELKRLHHNIKGTLLYVTHDQVEAMTLGDQVIVMREGEIHQIGTPEQIYEKPADTFVAKFIGSPEMNLYKGELIRHGDHLSFKIPDFSVDLTDVPKDLITGQIELGFRPEDIRFGDKTGILFNAEVELLSNIGSEHYIHSHLGREPLTIRGLREVEYKTGETITFSIDPDRIHFFRKGYRI